jgi:antitoxin VapB
MALNIKNQEVERLAKEVSELAHETKTEAIRKALEERKLRLRLHAVDMDRGEKAFGFLEREVWPYLPANVRGKSISKEEKEEILGYGPDGV